jgi:hypothetical protein
MAEENLRSDGRNLRGLVDAAIEIACKRRKTLNRLRAALEIHDDAEALRVARELCGLEDEKTGNRVNPSFN